MSTRLIKILTTFCILIAVLLMVGWPAWVGSMPGKESKKSVKLAFVQRGLAVASGLTFVVIGAGVGAFVLMRRAREEYRQASIENMKDLIEGAREDHLSKDKDGD